jgi:hypothetical protein
MIAMLGMQAIQSLVDNGNPAPPMANAAGIASPGCAADCVEWRTYVESLAGFSNHAVGTESGDAMLAATSPRMRRMVLRFRVSKKLLLWSVLFSGKIRFFWR